MKILFSHELSDAWGRPINKITILDSDKENLNIVNGYGYVSNSNIKYTIPISDIEKIKVILSDDKIYAHTKFLDAPILDGTQHDLYFSDLDKSIETECHNLWFWLDEKEFDDEFVLNYNTKEQIEYTKLMIDVISKIQDILNHNKINFHIIDEEEAEPEVERPSKNEDIKTLSKTKGVYVYKPKGTGKTRKMTKADLEKFENILLK